MARAFGGPLPGSIGGQAAELKARGMSGRAIGRELGVDEKTVRRWLSGETKSTRPEVAERLESRVRAERATAATPDRLKVEFSYAGRVRKVEFRPDLPPGASKALRPETIDKVAAAYADGDTRRMEKAFIDGVRDGFYHDRMEEGWMADGGATSPDYDPHFT